MSESIRMAIESSKDGRICLENVIHSLIRKVRSAKFEITVILKYFWSLKLTKVNIF